MTRGQIAVFCSASTKIDPKYYVAAREMIHALHALGYSFISGGGDVGIMGAIGRAATECGAHHVGVLPHFMKGLEYPGLSEVVWTDTMASRKEYMRKDSCAAIALPGGIGTIDEFDETHTLLKLRQYHGKLFMLNVDGFFDPYVALLNHLVKTGMMEKADLDLICMVRTVEELSEYLR